MASLEEKFLYALVYGTKGNSIGTCHHALYLHAGKEGGHLFHCTNEATQGGGGSGSWRYEYKNGYLLTESKKVILIHRIGDFSGKGSGVSELIKSIGEVLKGVVIKSNASKFEFDCKSWFYDAIDTLVKAGFLSWEGASNSTNLSKEIDIQACIAQNMYNNSTGGIPVHNKSKCIS